VLESVELLRVRIPLVEPFRTAHGVTSSKDALLVHVQTTDAEGWGECTAQRTPSYEAETIDSARLSLRDHLVPRAFSGAPFDDVAGNRQARAALEHALLDARLRATGQSLAAYLGATADRVAAGVAIGECASPGELRAKVEHFVATGYRRIKCKVGRDRAPEKMQAAHSAIPAGVDLAADANGCYALKDDLAILGELDELRLQCIEQPLGRDQFLAHAQLRNELRTPICLDESIDGIDAVDDAMELGAADVVCLKPGRLGLAAAVAAHDHCVESRWLALAGGMLETGIGRAVLVAFAARDGFALRGDCAASDAYFGPAGDITEPFVLADGHIGVPDGPGIGVAVLEDRIERLAIARERLLPS
jgi:o-succinylbenzoate synthase